ncbi:MAG: D-alanine--D-alanine ligase [Elusimicrobiota bacterium]
MNIKRWLKNKRIGVIYGGRSAERKISLLSGKAVLQSLKKMGYNAVGIDAGSDLPFRLKKNKIDFAYIILHGPWGEDGTVQGLLEIMDIPYTGCGVAASALTMNKVYSKMVFDSLDFPTPEWQVVNKGCLPSSFFRLPAVVKPVSQGSAIGVSIVKKKAELKHALKEAFKYDKQALIERYIKGTEVTVGVVGGKALPVVEIVPENEFYDFESKYKPGMSRHIMPPRLPKSVVKNASDLAMRAFRALGCRGLSRIDLMVDSKGKSWLLEINTIPGMTETSLLPDAAKAIGMDFGGLVSKIIECSVAGSNRK